MGELARRASFYRHWEECEPDETEMAMRARFVVSQGFFVRPKILGERQLSNLGCVSFLGSPQSAISTKCDTF
jgi:hypothetical protein